VVHTATEALEAQRRIILEMLLADYHDPGYARACREETEFQNWVRRYGAQRPAWTAAATRYAVDSDPNPFVWVDLNKCILCTRCVRACDEVQGCFVWGVDQRGRAARLVAGADSTMLEAGCESCGACAEYCPTGALDHRMSLRSGTSDRQVTTTCGYCGVGCQFDLQVKADRITGVLSNPRAPVNGMSLCVKGRYGYDFVHHPDRLQRPRVREYLLPNSSVKRQGGERGAWVEVDWNTALDLVASRFAEMVTQSGPDALGILASAKCSNEENYLMQKFARQVIGTNNVDHCARLCHSPTVAALSMSFGSGAMSNSMRDVAEHAQALLIIGSNTTEQHPVFAIQLRQAVLRRGVKLVVADPRRIPIADFSALHLRHRPGTDVLLLNGLMHIVLEHQWHDREFIQQRCENFQAFRETIARYTPGRVAQGTGIPVAQLHQAAEILARNRPLAAIWAMGITQHTSGVLNVLSLANLQMLLGNMGVPGGGVNPLRGQNNVQGACDMGALPDVFTGYQPVTDAAVRAKFHAAWKCRPVADTTDPTAAADLSSRPGKTVTELIDAAGRGILRGLFILGEDPIMTDPDSTHVRRSLQAAELVVLQELFPSETAAVADVLLPGASFAEKSGTFTNTERRVQLVRPAVPPPGQARADWQIICDLARRVLHAQRRLPAGTHAGWDYASPAEILDEAAALTPSYAGISHGRLEQGESLQWPVPHANHPGVPILHVGHFTRGRGRFHAVDHLPPHEEPDAEYPLVLTTGRVLYHWHGGEMTRRSAGLLQVYSETLVEISPQDAMRAEIKSGQPVRVSSRRGTMDALAWVTDRVAPGVVFGNFHFPGPANVNNLTITALDPVAKIPEYKVCAVRVDPLAAYGENPG
jgi:formate dehydrogenase alpha subunit